MQPTNKQRRVWKETHSMLSPLLSRSRKGKSDRPGTNEDEIDDDDDDDDDDDERSDEENVQSANCFKMIKRCFRRTRLRRTRGVDEKIGSGVVEDARYKLRKFSERLDGVNSMLYEKIVGVQEKLENLNERCNELADQMLAKDKCTKRPSINTNKMDLVSIMKEIDVYTRQYDFFSNIRVNLIKLRANTDVHAFSDTIKDALSLIPSNMKKIRAEREFCLATRYSDALDEFAQRMELPLSTVELERLDLEESYEVQIDALLREREKDNSMQLIREIGGPGDKVQPTVVGSARRVPVRLN